MSFDFISSQDFSIIFLFLCVDLQYLLLRWLLFLSLNMSSLSDLLKSNQNQKKKSSQSCLLFSIYAKYAPKPSNLS